jgi:hypothetical protein
MKRNYLVALVVLGALGGAVLGAFRVPAGGVMTSLGWATGVAAMLYAVAFARRIGRGAALGMFLFGVGVLMGLFGPWWAQLLGIIMLGLSAKLLWQHRHGLRGEPPRTAEPNAPPR